MTRELEAVVWCPVCMADKYTVYRVSTGQQGVFANEVDPRGSTAKQCEVCGTVLERK